MFLRQLLFKQQLIFRTQRYYYSVKVGDRFPTAIVAVVKHEEQEGFSNEIVDINEYFENKSVVLIGYPGAFTPTCMAQHIP
jgi:peroxiredoxin